MKSDFRTAIRTLRTSSSNLVVVPVNGCCYGVDNHPDKGDYYKYCGQAFWRFISGNDQLYTQIIKPLDRSTGRERKDDFITSYSKMLSRFTKEFVQDFCSSDGEVDWVKLLKFNSGEKRAV